MKKKILIHPMITTVIHTGISNLDGREYSHAGRCPVCGGKLTGYDKKRRFFASLSDKGEIREVHVIVKRFTCRTCGGLVPADAPFYPDTRIGAPIVDLCVTLSQEMSWSRAATVVRELGIVIDRGSVRNYVREGFLPVPSTEVFGFRLPVSILSLCTSSLGAVERSPVVGAEPFVPGRLPSANGTSPRLPLFEKRDQRDKKEEKEERPPV
ncbi:MAG TPA: hypothetical protein VMS89_06050 [Methanoregulaceae archaeon]|nr:hypothetical protein [Methanoregulaceae archaeon]